MNSGKEQIQNGDVVCVITDLHSPEVAKQTAEFSKELHSEGILDLLGREGVPEFDAEKLKRSSHASFFDRCIGPLNPESTWEGFWALNSKPGPLEAPFLNAQLPTVGLEPNSTYRNYLAAFNLFSIEYEFLSKTLNAENIPIWETGDKKQMLVFESPIGAEIDDSIARINYWESVLREGFPSIPSLREDFISHTQTGATCIFIEDQAYFNAHHQAVIDWTNINLNWPRNKTAPTVLRQQMHRVHAHRAGMVYGAKHTVHRGVR
jgi:hypothetical protein